MKIVLPGGSGHVGTVLATAFHESGDDVVVLSRAPRPAPWRTVAWDGGSVGPWCGELDGADVVLNLAGRSVNCRYTPAHRAEIRESRVDSTRVVGEAIARAARPPRTWLQASTATLYAHRFDAPNDEATGILGGSEPGVPETWRFSIEVATAWEAAARAAAAATPRTRLVLLRSAILMAPLRGGPFDLLLALVRWRLGGAVGDGRQFVSWIHDADFVRAVRFLVAREDVAGAVNVAAPHPLPNAEFMRALREAWGIRFGIPGPAPLMELAALAHRTETELVLKSRRVVPGRLLEAGFTFEFPEWPSAARDLCARWREARERAA